jgi:hypothetical protein
MRLSLKSFEFVPIHPLRPCSSILVYRKIRRTHQYTAIFLQSHLANSTSGLPHGHIMDRVGGWFGIYNYNLAAPYLWVTQDRVYPSYDPYIGHVHQANRTITRRGMCGHYIEPCRSWRFDTIIGTQLVISLCAHQNDRQDSGNCAEKIKSMIETMVDTT